MINICEIEENDKVSIIIPVYNGEKYIAECLQSVLDQSYKNLEIIVINDGSTDRTRNIINKFATDNNRVRNVNVQNGGVASARNIGLNMISGKYVLFVDADDMLEKDAVKVMLHTIKKKKCDIVVCGGLGSSQQNVIETEMTEQEFFCEMLYEKRFYSVCWGKLYKADLINKYRFDTDYKIGEDLELFARLTLEQFTVCYIEKNVYIYRDNNHSITKVEYNSDWEKEILLCRKIIFGTSGKVRDAAIARYIRVNASCISYAIRAKRFDKISWLKKNICHYLIIYTFNGNVSTKLKLKVWIKLITPVFIARLYNDFRATR